jgi:hypothetical protein
MNKGKLLHARMGDFTSLVLTFTVIFLIGCGGGTRGTGIGESGTPAHSQDSQGIITGIVVDGRGVGLEGVRIRVVEQDEFITTDERGEFTIHLNQSGLAEVTLEISLSNTTLSGRVPASEEFISLRIDIDDRVVVVVDESGNSIVESELKDL